jgi:hypothetical protein
LRVQVLVLPSIETEERLLAEARQRKREAEERDMMSAAEQDTLMRLEAARQQAIREAEEARLEAERLAKEAARKKAEEEAAYRAMLKARADKEATEIVVPVHPVFDHDAVLAEIKITHGSTVEALSEAVFRAARLPFHPRLLLGSEVLAPKKLLIDVGVEPMEPVLAEMCAVLTSSKDCTAKVWDALSGELLYNLEGHAEPVCSATASPDLKWFVTASEDQTAKLWVVQRDLRAASCLFTMRGHTKAVHSVAFSDDCKWIVTGSSDNTAKIWAVRTGECKRTFEGHRGAVFAASFSPDGMCLYTQARDSTAKVWEVETGRCTSTEPLWDQPEVVTSAAADGRIVVTSDGGTAATVKEVGSERERRLDLHMDSITSIKFVEVRVPTRSREQMELTRTRTSPMNKQKSMGTTSPKGFGMKSPTKTNMRATR